MAPLWKKIGQKYTSIGEMVRLYIMYCYLRGVLVWVVWKVLNEAYKVSKLLMYFE